MDTISITLDKAGRVLIPKSVRDELGLAAGDSLELELRGDEIIVRPVRLDGELREQGRFMVFYSGAGPMSAEIARKAIADNRDERSMKVAGLID